MGGASDQEVSLELTPGINKSLHAAVCVCTCVCVGGGVGGWEGSGH